MSENVVAVLIFLALLGAAFLGLWIHDKLPARYRQEDTYSVVRVAAGFFVVIASLVLSLLLNSAKNKYEMNDLNMHAFATELILLDRSLRQYGSEAEATRRHLLAYTQRALETTWPTQGKIAIDDKVAEELLDLVEVNLNELRTQEFDRAYIWQEARRHLQRALELRWGLVADAESDIPKPLLAMLVTWLIVIFVSMGYRAPRNPVVIASFVISALLLAGSIHLTIDFDTSFTGLINLSPTAMQRALAFMQQ